MKRASLSALPARAKAEPADLTDRLLARETAPAPDHLPEPAAPAEAAPARPAAARPAAKAPGRKRRATAKISAPAPTNQVAAPASPNADGTGEPVVSIAQALRQAQDAAQSLQSAARGVPARYELAVRYRLEALAHHFQQVAEFIGGRTPPEA